MPANGVVNSNFGVYRTICCNAEIVIPEGAVFPDCPKHLNLSTEWKLVEDDQIRHVTHYLAKKKETAA
jgi:hypothetical protein